MCEFTKSFCQNDCRLCAVACEILCGRCASAIQLLEADPEVLDRFVRLPDSKAKFYLWICRLGKLLVNVRTDPDYKRLITFVLGKLDQHSYVQSDLIVTVALACDGPECMWQVEYVQVLQNRLLPIDKKKHIQPRHNQAMIAAWEAWQPTLEEQNRLDREREEKEKQRRETLAYYDSLAELTPEEKWNRTWLLSQSF